MGCGYHWQHHPQCAHQLALELACNSNTQATGLSLVGPAYVQVRFPRRRTCTELKTAHYCEVMEAAIVGSDTFGRVQSGIPTHRYGGPGNSYSEDPSQRRLRFKLDGLVTAEAQPHIRRLSNRWLSITGMIIHGHLTCRDSFGDIFTLTSGVEPTATSNSYIHETANLRSIASPASYIRTSGQAYPVDEEPTNWQVHLHGINPPIPVT